MAGRDDRPGEMSRLRYRPTLAGVMALAIFFNACGGGEADSSGSEATIASSSTSSSSVPEAPSAAPRWETVADFHGEGVGTTDSFIILPDAIQWRVRWRCQGAGALTITGAPALKKPLLVERDCPKEGTAYAIQAGPRRLNVDATGPWRMTVDQQVDTPIDEAPLPDMATAKILGSGDFYDIEKKGKGTARLYELHGGSRAIRLEEFEVTQNTDLFVWLSEATSPRTSAEVVAKPYVQIAVLRSTSGSQNYLVPPEIATDKIRSIVIWCEPVHIAYAAAALSGT